jgi:hypothetical protein
MSPLVSINRLPRETAQVEKINKWIEYVNQLEHWLDEQKRGVAIRRGTDAETENSKFV